MAAALQRRAAASDLPDLWMDRWLPALYGGCGLVALAVYAATAAPTLSWRNGGDDGGDLAVAAASLGVAHPTGYPFYVLLGWSWLRLFPIGDVGHRLSVFSGLCSAVAIAMAAWAGAELIRCARPEVGRRETATGAAAAALLLGVSAPLWGQAVVVSVFSLNLAFAGALLGLALRAQRLGPSTRAAGVFGGLLGVGLGNHVTLAFVGLAGAAIGIWRRWPWRIWVVAGLATAIGLMAVYSYLLLGRVEMRDPIGAWGDPSTPSGLLNLVTAHSYQGLLGRVPAGQAAGRAVRAAALLVQVLTPVGLLAAIAGAASALTATAGQEWRQFIGPLVLAVAALGFAITYGGARGEHHLLLMYLAIALLAGVGLADALTLLGKLGARGWLLGTAGLALLLTGAGWASRGVAAGSDQEAVQFAQAALEAQPPNGQVSREDDAHIFALWYAQDVLGVRPDVAVIQPGLWQANPLYRAKLLARHPWLASL
ncbi:MAG TPA: DUF2723 domain-containing protein [Chloroflexota bacterium]|nr:DUF2723 domain-containing protein [Chloroflexota bacterium]